MTLEKLSIQSNKLRAGAAVAAGAAGFFLYIVGLRRFSGEAGLNEWGDRERPEGGAPGADGEQGHQSTEPLRRI